MIRIGETREFNGFRVHRFSQSVEVTETVNAGKRGKTCRRFAICAWRFNESFLDDYASGIEGETFDSLLADALFLKSTTPGMEMDPVRALRGVDVEPTGFEAITIQGVDFHLSSEFDHFSAHANDIKEESIIPPCHGGAKTAIKEFRAFVKANRDRIAGWRFHELTTALYEAGIHFHQYCAMD
jgi:hypothetical protein